MVYQSERSLLNIESVYPLEAFSRLPEYRCHMADCAYANFVAGLYRQSLVKSGTTQSVPGPVLAAMPPSRGTLHRFWLRRSRRIMRRIRNHLPHLDLIQY
jgi:hypothetical protein